MAVADVAAAAAVAEDEGRRCWATISGDEPEGKEGGCILGKFLQDYREIQTFVLFGESLRG